MFYLVNSQNLPGFIPKYLKNPTSVAVLEHPYRLPLEARFRGDPLQALVDSGEDLTLIGMRHKNGAGCQKPLTHGFAIGRSQFGLAERIGADAHGRSAPGEQPEVVPYAPIDGHDLGG